MFIGMSSPVGGLRTSRRILPALAHAGSSVMPLRQSRRSSTPVPSRLAAVHEGSVRPVIFRRSSAMPSGGSALSLDSRPRSRRGWHAESCLGQGIVPQSVQYILPAARSSAMPLGVSSPVTRSSTPEPSKFARWILPVWVLPRLLCPQYILPAARVRCRGSSSPEVNRISTPEPGWHAGFLFVAALAVASDLARRKVAMPIGRSIPVTRSSRIRPDLDLAREPVRPVQLGIGVDVSSGVGVGVGRGVDVECRAGGNAVSEDSESSTMSSTTVADDGISRIEPVRMRFGSSISFASIRLSTVVPNCSATDRKVSPAWTTYSSVGPRLV